MIFRDLYAAIETMSYALESLSVHALKNVKIRNRMDDAELVLFTTLPIFNAGAITPMALQTLFPFNSLRLIRQKLTNLEHNKLLLPTKENHYALTPQGDSLQLWIVKEVNNALAGVLPLPATSMMDMASQLKGLADACYAAMEPPVKLHLAVQRKLTPAGTIPIMARINQITRELMAYRTDAHYSAWQAYGVNGHTWEILTTLWQTQKMKVDELHQSLLPRGFTIEETYNALNDLARRGWVANSNDELSITPFGSEVRRIAEDTTDRYYFTPWRGIAEEKLSALKDMINEFRRGIPELVD